MIFEQESKIECYSVRPCSFLEPIMDYLLGAFNLLQMFADVRKYPCQFAIVNFFEFVPVYEHIRVCSTKRLNSRIQNRVLLVN